MEIRMYLHLDTRTLHLNYAIQVNSFFSRALSSRVKKNSNQNTKRSSL